MHLRNDTASSLILLLWVIILTISSDIGGYIFGKIIKDMFSNDIVFDNIQYSIYIFGFLSAFLTGIFACRLMLKIVRNNSLNIFSAYCIVLGAVSIIIASI